MEMFKIREGERLLLEDMSDWEVDIEKITNYPTREDLKYWFWSYNLKTGEYTEPGYLKDKKENKEDEEDV